MDPAVINATSDLPMASQVQDIGAFFRDEVAVWGHLVILVLGFITNPLIIVVLSKKQVGSACKYCALIEWRALCTPFTFYLLYRQCIHHANQTFHDTCSQLIKLKCKAKPMVGSLEVKVALSSPHCQLVNFFYIKITNIVLKLHNTHSVEGHKIVELSS